MNETLEGVVDAIRSKNREMTKLVNKHPLFNPDAVVTYYITVWRSYPSSIDHARRSRGGLSAFLNYYVGKAISTYASCDHDLTRIERNRR